MTWHILNPLAWWGLWMLMKIEWTHGPTKVWCAMQTIPQYDRRIIVSIADWTSVEPPQADWTFGSPRHPNRNVARLLGLGRLFRSKTEES